MSSNEFAMNFFLLSFFFEKFSKFFDFFFEIFEFFLMKFSKF